MADEKHNSELLKAIGDAQIALIYASQKGTAIEQKVIHTIVSAKEFLNTQNYSVDAETGFWLAYASLTKLIHPATIDSITWMQPAQKTDLTWYARLFKMSMAKQMVNVYRWVAFIVLAIMLCVQVYWVMGSGLISDFKTIPAQIEVLSSEMNERISLLEEQAANDPEIQVIEAKILNLEEELDASSQGLIEWNKVWLGIKNIFETSEDTVKISKESEPIFAIKYASFVLEAIQYYLLPLLYGLLGAFSYVLRNLASDIKEKVYTKESNINYILRLHLGTLAGLAIGWFFGNGSGGISSAGIGSLSPLALAFLAGYSVEVLFSGMDKLIAAISAKKPAQEDVPKLIPTK